MAMNKKQQFLKKEGGARLAAIRVNNIDDSLEVSAAYIEIIIYN
jgi:hypothetical protein